MRVGMKFARTGDAKFISHLDMQRVMGRALRRSGLPVKYSEGFNPHIVMSFASALPVGMETEGDYLEFKLEFEVEIDKVHEALRRSMPEGITALKAWKIQDSAPKLMAAAAQSEYEIGIETSSPEKFQKAMHDLLERESCIIEKKKKGKVRQVDIRPLIQMARYEQNTGVLHIRLMCSGENSLTPKTLLSQLENQDTIFGVSKLVRKNLYYYNKGELISLEQL